MWLISELEAVTLFSLKMSSATSSGGKTLLIPTPYAIKMALLDAACRMMGVEKAEAIWPVLRDLQVAIRPAEKVVVTNLFQKVLRPRRNPAGKGDQDSGPFQKTIGYREYAHYVGSMGLGLGWSEEENRNWLSELLVSINYFGKRGSFMQMLVFPQHEEQLPPGFVEVTIEQDSFLVNGTLQMLDDCSPSLTFGKANIYSGEKVKSGKDRVIRNVVLPYRLARSSKSFSLYERFSA